MLAYDDIGEGKPFVLVHGLATTRMVWRRTMPFLAGRRLIAVDVPGFGASPPAGPGFDLSDVAATILAGLPVDGRFTLVGHSMGGAIALTLAAQAPERVARLILCAPAGIRTYPAAAGPVLGRLAEAALQVRRAASPLAVSPLGRRILMGAGATNGDAISRADVSAMVASSGGATRISEALATVACTDLRPLLPRAPAALGLLWGAHDRVVSPSLIQVVQQARPDAVTEIVPLAGHLPMMEQPEAFAALLLQVVARLDDTQRCATSCGMAAGQSPDES